jgi:glutamine cyclotransferase
MLQCQSLRQRLNRRYLTLRQSANHQQKQILLRFKTCCTRHAVARMQEMADTVTKFRQCLVFFRGDFCRHISSISYCDRPGHLALRDVPSDHPRDPQRPLGQGGDSAMRGQGIRWSPRFAGRALLLLLATLGLACRDASHSKDAPPADSLVAMGANQAKTVPVTSASVVKTYPHDPKAFTQGLEYYDGHLYESTGRSGESTLRECRLETGETLRRVDLPSQYFGEGLTIFHGKIYQLTWLSKLGFIYDLRTFHKIGEFHYPSEGWGLTHDDTSLILSDGTNRLQFIDPASFAVTRTIEVYAGDEAVTNLNELESINGEIFSNVWHSSRIARIDPHSGRVLAWIDLTPLGAREPHGPEDVLNGIAYDGKRGRIFVTGKHWSEMIEIKLESKPNER